MSVVQNRQIFTGRTGFDHSHTHRLLLPVEINTAVSFDWGRDICRKHWNRLPKTVVLQAERQVFRPSVQTTPTKSGCISAARKFASHRSFLLIVSLIMISVPVVRSRAGVLGRLWHSSIRMREMLSPAREIAMPGYYGSFWA